MRDQSLREAVEFFRRNENKNWKYPGLMQTFSVISARPQNSSMRQILISKTEIYWLDSKGGVI